METEIIAISILAAALVVGLCVIIAAMIMTPVPPTEEEKVFSFEDLRDEEWYWYHQYLVQYDQKATAKGMYEEYLFKSGTRPGRLAIPKGQIKTLVHA